MWRFSAQGHELRAIQWFHGCVSPHKATNAGRPEPGRDALIHSHQKSTIHRFLMVRTIGRVVMKLPA